MASIMIAQTARCIEIHLVYNFPYYFYTRVGNGEDVTSSVSAAEANRIFTAVASADQLVIEGQPKFDTSSQPWAVSAWVMEVAT